MGYHHPSGEVHITDNNQWVACPGEDFISGTKEKKGLLGYNPTTGQDNTNSQCTVGDVPNLLAGNGSDHDGPYDGVKMGC